jgi:hypothetical protein
MEDDDNRPAKEPERKGSGKATAEKEKKRAGK